MHELAKNNYYNNLKYIFSNIGQITNFSEMKDPVTLHDGIKNGEILEEKAKIHKQEDFDRYLRKIMSEKIIRRTQNNTR